ncbi:MAG: alpha/beta hydrolase [Chitinophagaceae bacterium]|nr:MAG: alpha/beta hydrolase [Chitinophagaceae bacterium]
MRVLFFVFFLGAFSLSAQDTFYFKKGLVVNAPVRYGREALYMDELAWQLYQGSLKSPADGVTFMNDEKNEPVKWKSVIADSANRLRGGGGGFGPGRRGPTYLYLSYDADKEKTALVNIRGNAGFYLNGEPHMGDAYGSGWLYIPVKLKKGLNEFYVRGTFVTASMILNPKPLLLSTEDATVPSLTPGQASQKGMAAIVVINSSSKEILNATVTTQLAGVKTETRLPSIPAMAMRKVMVEFDASGVKTTGQHRCELKLSQKSGQQDTSSIILESPVAGASYSGTFISAIDGSLQYYAVTPQLNAQPSGNALFLSVHGAGVEAIGQARAYKPKDWGTLVAATNRRPRGFNWEDWGRIDALEVLEIAKQKFNPDPKRIYLTGHSMGGHGTWFLGATYPDKWAGIAPCAGYPTLKGYGSADGLIPDSSANPIEKILLRSSNQSDMIKLATNYKPLGVYIFHGDADRTVSVNYARQMKKVLADFHPDMSYYEYPGGSHWFGDHSVDWKPIFDFFRWHSLPEDTAINTIDFTTASPGISASMHWASVIQQMHPLEYSRIKLNRNRGTAQITGSTENVNVLKLTLDTWKAGTNVKIVLDGSVEIMHTVAGDRDSVFLQKQENHWVKSVAPGVESKGPHRYGTFKEAFNHNMVFVYGTTGNAEENKWAINKARFDAETWYYRGNGAVDIISDKAFDLKKYAGRGVIIFGNATTNSAYKTLLADCPINVQRGKITAGNKSWQGDDLAAYFVWPIKGSTYTSVAVIAGTGVKGMNAANANQYFAGASGFPDFMIYSADMLHEGTKHLKSAGFFNNNWKLADTDQHAVD